MDKVLITTPLYPPDIAPLAVYVKEVARRLSAHREITVLAYGQFPEKVPGVRIVSISKNTLLPIRLFYFLLALIQETRHADYIYTQNGASVELPVLLACFFMRTPFIFHLGDTVALTTSKQHWALRKLTRIMTRSAIKAICSETEDVSWVSQTDTLVHIDTPMTRPEILPFALYPKQEFTDYEQSWNTHIDALTTLFHYAKK